MIVKDSQMLSAVNTVLRSKQREANIIYFSHACKVTTAKLSEGI